MRWVIVLGVVLACALAALWGYVAGYHVRLRGWYRCKGLAKQIDAPVAECRSLLEECEQGVQESGSAVNRAVENLASPERLDKVFAIMGRGGDSPDISSADEVTRADTAARAACEKAAAEAASAVQKRRDEVEQAAEAWSRLESAVADGGGVQRRFCIIKAISWGYVAWPEKTDGDSQPLSESAPAPIQPFRFNGFTSGENSANPDDTGGTSDAVFLGLAGRHESGEAVRGLFVECGTIRIREGGGTKDIRVYAQSADMAQTSQTVDELETRIRQLSRQMETLNQRVQTESDRVKQMFADELVHFEGVSQIQRAYLNGSFANTCDLVQSLPPGAYARNHQQDFLNAVESVGRCLARQGAYSTAVVQDDTDESSPRAPVAPAPRRDARRDAAAPLPAPVAPERERPDVFETARPEQAGKEARVVAVWAGTIVTDCGRVDGVGPGAVLVAEMREYPIPDPANPMRVLGYEVSSMRVEKADRTLSLCRPVSASDRMPSVGDVVKIESTGPR